VRQPSSLIIEIIRYRTFVILHPKGIFVYRRPAAGVTKGPNQSLRKLGYTDRGGCMDGNVQPHCVANVNGRRWQNENGKGNLNREWNWDHSVVRDIFEFPETPPHTLIDHTL